MRKKLTKAERLALSEKLKKAWAKRKREANGGKVRMTASKVEEIRTYNEVLLEALRSLLARKPEVAGRVMEDAVEKFLDRT